MTVQVSMKSLLETGVHFGHRTRKWNPKMSPYIFTERNGIHILDLHQTLQSLKDISNMVSEVVADGGKILFVGTKRQAQETISREAQRCYMPYVNERWLGGTMTNWRTIRQRIEYLKELEERRDRGEFDLLTKKEALTLTRTITKLTARLGGIREMGGLPKMLFIVDVRREYTAVHEASILNIPIIAMVDTNCDPDKITHIIPSNDDAIRAIKLIAGIIADSVLEGQAMRKDENDEDGFLAPTPDYDYEAEADKSQAGELLGEATLTKLQDGSLDFSAEEAAEKEAAEKFAAEKAAAEAAAAPEAEAEAETPAETTEEAPKAEAANDES